MDLQVDGYSHMVNINLKFLPPDTTSHLQPCVGGTIQAVKVYYCCRPCLQTLKHMDATAAAFDLVRKITLLDPILMLRTS